MKLPVPFVDGRFVVGQLALVIAEVAVAAVATKLPLRVQLHDLVTGVAVVCASLDKEI